MESNKFRKWAWWLIKRLPLIVFSVVWAYMRRGDPSYSRNLNRDILRWKSWKKDRRIEELEAQLRKANTPPSE